MTSKGQVTIPVEVRRELDVQLGDELIFSLREGELVTRAIKHRALTELQGVLPATRTYPGRDKVRAETAQQLGQELVRKLSPAEGHTTADGRLTGDLPE